MSQTEVIDYMSMLLKLYLVPILYLVPNKLKNLMKFHFILASSVLLIYTRGKLTMGAKGIGGGGVGGVDQTETSLGRNDKGRKWFGDEMSRIRNWLLC